MGVANRSLQFAGRLGCGRWCGMKGCGGKHGGRLESQIHWRNRRSIESVEVETRDIVVGVDDDLVAL
jgi:hypothetical protein